MKRAVALILLGIMLLSLCACGNKIDLNAVDDALQGAWYETVEVDGKLSFVMVAVWAFDDGNVSWATSGNPDFLGGDKSDTGTYTIDDEIIHITMEEHDWEFAYTYEDGVLTVINGSTELEKYLNSIPTATEKPELITDDEIESIVVIALYNEIDSKYDTADADSCRYNINKTEEKSGYIYVYGSVTLYDKYGKTTGGWVDGSGTAYRSFTVKINANTGRAVSCEIK